MSKKFKVYKSLKNVNCFFSLQEDDGDVLLNAVTKDGEFISNVLCIHNDGNIILYGDVSESTGLNLDEDGCVRTGIE